MVPPLRVVFGRATLLCAALLLSAAVVECDSKEDTLGHGADDSSKAAAERTFLSRDDYVLRLNASSLERVVQTIDSLFIIYVDPSVQTTAAACAEAMKWHSDEARNLALSSSPEFNSAKVAIVDMSLEGNEVLAEGLGGMAFYPLVHYHEQGGTARAVDADLSFFAFLATKDHTEAVVLGSTGDPDIWKLSPVVAIGCFDSPSEKSTLLDGISQFAEFKHKVAFFKIFDPAVRRVYGCHKRETVLLLNSKYTSRVANVAMFKMLPGLEGDSQQVKQLLRKAGAYPPKDYRKVAREIKGAQDYDKDDFVRGAHGRVLYVWDGESPKPVAARELAQLSLTAHNDVSFGFVDARKERLLQTCNHDFGWVFRDGEPRTGTWKKERACVVTQGALGDYGITEEKLPVVIFENWVTSMVYKSHGTLPELSKFLIGVQDGAADQRPYFKSLEHPQDPNSPLLEISGVNFADSVLANDHDVAVLVYRPQPFQDPQTGVVEAVWRKLAAEMKHIGTLKFAKMDGFNNHGDHPIFAEVKKQHVGYPWVVIFPGKGSEAKLNMTKANGAYRLASRATNPIHYAWRLREFCTASAAEIEQLYPQLPEDGNPMSDTTRFKVMSQQEKAFAAAEREAAKAAASAARLAKEKQALLKRSAAWQYKQPATEVGEVDHGEL